MKLKVISDGTPAGFKVVSEDGRPVEGVQFVKVHLTSCPRFLEVSMGFFVEDPEFEPEKPKGSHGADL